MCASRDSAQCTLHRSPGRSARSAQPRRNSAARRLSDSRRQSALLSKQHQAFNIHNDSGLVVTVWWPRHAGNQLIIPAGGQQGLSRPSEQVSVAQIGLSGPIEDMQVKGAEVNMVVEGYTPLLGLPLEKVGKRYLKLSPDAGANTDGTRVHYLQWVVERTGGTRIVRLQSLLRLHNATQLPLAVRVWRRHADTEEGAAAKQVARKDPERYAKQASVVTLLPDQVWHAPVYLASESQLAVRPAVRMSRGSPRGGAPAGAGVGAGAGAQARADGTPAPDAEVVPVADLSGGCQFEGQAASQADCSGSYTFDPRFTWSYPMVTSSRASATITARPQDGTGLPITETDFDRNPTHILSCPPGGGRQPPTPATRSFVYLEVSWGRCAWAVISGLGVARLTACAGVCCCHRV